MNKRGKIVPIVLCLGALVSACGGEEAFGMASDNIPVEIVLESDYDNNGQQSSQLGVYNIVADDTTGAFSEDQAFNAVRNYYKSINPDYDNNQDMDDYWDVSRGENGEIVVTYRSYTGSINRYYVDAISGNTYVTEQVPGIIEDEQLTSENFNIKYYLVARG
jgi:hypothetical protein